MKSLLLSSAMLAAAGLSTGAASAQQMTADELGPVIREYLLQNPAVVIEAIELYQQLEEERGAAGRPERDQDQREAIYNASTAPVVGDADAPLTIVEFFDYQCGYCKRAAAGLQAAMTSRSDIKIVMKELPILGPDSVVAARAALAARAQDKYEDMHWALITYKGRLSERAIMAIAEEQGIDVDRLRKDMQSPEVQAEISRVSALARSLNVNGTPAFIVGDQLIPGAVPTEQLIALAEANR